MATNFLAARNSNLSSFNAVSINYSMLRGSTIASVSTMNVSTIVNSNITAVGINYSTLVGSSIVTNALSANALMTQSLAYSTLTGSSITGSSMTVGNVQGTSVSATTVMASTLNATGNAIVSGVVQSGTAGSTYFNASGAQKAGGIFITGDIAAAQWQLALTGGYNLGFLLNNTGTSGPNSNYTNVISFGNTGLISCSGIISTNFTTSDFIIGNLGSTYLAGKWLTLNLNNVGTVYPTSGYAVTNSLSIGANFTNGSSEVDFMNNNGQGFNFYARTGTSSSNLLMVIRGDGNVGIGITNPGYALDIRKSLQLTGNGFNTTRSDNIFFNVKADDSSNGDGGSIIYSNSINLRAGDLVWTSRAYGAQIYIGGGYSVYATINPGELKFYTGNAERMTILGNGSVGIGITNPASPLHVVGDVRLTIGYALYLYYLSASNCAYITTNGNGDILIGTGTAGVATRMYINNIGQVWLQSLGTGPVYSQGGILTSTNPSDPSLKNNIMSLNPSIDLINQLNPVQFNWIDTEKYGAGLKYGFLANEVQAIFPNIVSTWLDDKGNEKLGYDSVSLIPVLTSAIKQQSAQISSLQSQLTQVLSQVAALTDRLAAANIA